MRVQVSFRLANIVVQYQLWLLVTGYPVQIVVSLGQFIFPSLPPGNSEVRHHHRSLGLR